MCVCVCVCTLPPPNGVSNVSTVDMFQYTSLYTVYEPPLVLIGIRSSAYTNLRIYDAPDKVLSVQLLSEMTLVQNDISA